MRNFILLPILALAVAAATPAVAVDDVGPPECSARPVDDPGTGVREALNARL